MRPANASKSARRIPSAAWVAAIITTPAAREPRRLRKPSLLRNHRLRAWAMNITWDSWTAGNSRKTAETLFTVSAQASASASSLTMGSTASTGASFEKSGGRSFTWFSWSQAFLASICSSAPL